MLLRDKEENKNFENLASKVKDLGLEKPVEFLVESHYPLSNLIYHMALLVEPILSPFFKVSRLEKFSSLLSSDDAREDFLDKLRSI